MSNGNSIKTVSFDYREEAQSLKFSLPEPKSKFVVYSADFGEYSGTANIINSALSCPDIQFVFFTDDTSISECPTNLNLCHVIDETVDKRLAAKYFKINSNSVLGDVVERSLWIDSNMALKQGFADFYSSYDSTDLTLVKHNKRHTISDELREVRKFGKESDRALNNLLQDFNRKYTDFDDLGLFQGRFLLRAHNTPALEFEGLWWSLILQYSIRDQLTLPIAIAKSSASLSTLAPQVSDDFYEVVSHLKYDFSVKSSSFTAFLRYLRGLLRYKAAFFIKRIKGGV